MGYLVQNISGKVQTCPKTLETLNHDINNWAIGQIDIVDDEAIGPYRKHADAWLIMAGPNLYAQAGSVPAATVTAGVTFNDTETGVNKTVLTLSNVSIATVDNTTNGAQGSLEIYDFPEGSILSLGATSNLTIARVGTNLTATAAVVGAIGTVVPAADATLTGTEADFIPSTVCTLSAGAGTFKGKSTATEMAIKDGTATAKKAYLNFAVPDAGSAGNDALLVNGTITLVWTSLGDN